MGKLLGATTIQVKTQLTQSEIDSAEKIASDGRTVIVCTSDVARNKAQADLIATLNKANVPIIVVATRSPYDLLYLNDVKTYLATYGSNPPLIDALAAIITGKSKSKGRLPVELSGLYKLGDGIAQ